MTELEEWKSNKQELTPKIRAEFEQAFVGDWPVVAVWDMVWWPDTSGIYVLAGVKLSNGSCLALGYADGEFMIPLSSSKSWTLSNLTEPPKLELGEDSINVYFSEEQYLMAMHGREYGTLAPPRTWRYSGAGSCGRTARRKFEEHGVKLEC